jgi:hypothetical protein
MHTPVATKLRKLDAINPAASHTLILQRWTTAERVIELKGHDGGVQHTSGRKPAPQPQPYCIVSF